MSIESILGNLVVAVLSKSASVKIGNYQLTATDTSGAPAHLTAQSALAGAVAVLTGHTGTIQSGNIQVTLGPVNSN